jgi:hypothetical protein
MLAMLVVLLWASRGWGAVFSSFALVELMLDVE